VKSETSLQECAKAFALCDTIIFDGRISNQEARWLERFRKAFGYKLVSPQTYAYGAFVRQLERVSGVRQDSYDDTGVYIVFGSRLADDAPEIFDSLLEVADQITYMHPIADQRWEKRDALFIKYEAMAEEGVAAMLLYGLTRQKSRSAFPDELIDFLDEIDIGFISAETSVGEEEVESLLTRIEEGTCTLMVGRDIYEHPRAVQIATLLGYLQRYTSVSIRCIPPFVNANGVLETCSLSKTAGERTIGYLQATKKQTNCLVCSRGDLRETERLGGEIIDWRGQTVPLPSLREYSALLEYLYTTLLEQKGRIDAQEAVASEREDAIECTLDSEIEVYDPLDGTVVYLCDLAKDDFFRQRKVCSEPVSLYASPQFAKVAKVNDGEMIYFDIDGKNYQRMLRIDTEMKGMIAISSVCDIDLSISSVSLSRFRCISIRKEKNA